MSSSAALVILGLEGLPTYYSCEELVHFSSDLTIFHIPIFYDLIIPITENPNDARRRFESVLLKHIAISYGLSDGSACTALGDEEDSKLIEVSTSWDDLPTANPESCMVLTRSSSEETCLSYTGTLSAKSIGFIDTNDFLDVVAQLINNGTVSTESSMRAMYLGTKINLGNGFGKPDQLLATKMDDELESNVKPFTLVGGAIAGALILSFMGVLFVKFRGIRGRSVGCGRGQKEEIDSLETGMEAGIAKVQSSLKDVKQTNSIELAIAEMEAGMKRKPWYAFW
eukprot:CAMPEP_0178921456 /NCGR_PEP_ID=MMETSP0786-20121207/15571_1 /TAXON_ID=186022 /ORGANISM="Thalassionema frauenfeldii, Strain CCMP 1798" /LENGTH=282 /DNA_ID=CAMNT_0020595637 /DNA_START=100 /DNA_END=948 /DNA_ORIENTATION=-